MLSQISSLIIHSYKEGYTPYLQDISAKYGSLPYDKKMEMAKSAAVINTILEITNSEGTKTGDVYKVYEQLVVEKKIEVSILKKLNYANFRKHISIWKNKGTDCTIGVKNTGNQNASTHKNDKEMEAWILHLRLHPRNFNGEHIKRIIICNCRLNDKDIPSDSWLSHQLADGHLKAIASQKRFDKGNRHRQGYESILHGLRCPMANDRWEVDSTRINMHGFEHNGKTVFLYGTWVYDNHSGDILGWAFSTSESPENRWIYTEALKMAVNRTGCLAREICFDRFPGHNTAEMKALFAKFECLGAKINITHRAEGKQHLERTIGTFQTVFLSQSKYYYGQGVKSSREAAHTTTEWQKSKSKELRSLGMGLEQMCNEAERFIEQYRTTKMTEYGRQNKHRIPYSPAELWQMSDKSNQKKVETWQISDLFWLEKPLSMRNQQFLTEINHEKCVYKVEDYEMLTILEREPTAIIRYDEQDLSEIYVFSKEKNEFLGCLKRFEIGVTRGIEANGALIGRHSRITAQIEEKRKAEVTKVLSQMVEEPIGYWGKEADFQRQEAFLMSETGSRNEDVYDKNWN